MVIFINLKLVLCNKRHIYSFLIHTTPIYYRINSNLRYNHLIITLNEIKYNIYLYI